MAIAQQPQPTVENHFIGGLKTEFTGLNFPDNAATDTQNCVFTLIGDVQRRGGINYETNFATSQINVSNVAKSSFRWLNAGGDGTSQILVQQIGNLLYFYKSSAATLVAPLSTTRLSSVIDISAFKSTGNTADPSQQECQYSMGNGYLFVFHPNCDPFYCVFTNNLVTATIINIQIRDVIGIPEGTLDSFRPTVLSQEHLYNLINQGWTQGSAWSGESTFLGAIPLADGNESITTMTLNITSQTDTSTVTPGKQMQVVLPFCSKTGANNNNLNGTVTLVGTVSSYNTTTVTLTITSNSNHQLNTTGFWSGGNFFFTSSLAHLTLVNIGFIQTWVTDLKSYPSNADVWWLYKRVDTGVFSPAFTFPSTQQLQSPAPKGSFVLNAFNQLRSNVSNVSGLTDVTTVSRPSTGAFYQGRVWYAGVNAFISATGDAPNTTWTENIYFSQIIESPINFGRCYTNNDPTSQDLFEGLASDGGVITIPGCGAIYKLFPLRFGLLVFAANGVWFIAGSTGIGFTATDATINKISSIQTIAGTSFIDIQGYPFFWNQEGIYEVTPTPQAGSAHSPDIQLDVHNICLGTILTYYSNIPLISKAYARGDYHQLDYIVQWCFRSTNESGIGNRYNYDTILNYNVITKAFYPYTLSSTTSVINDIKFIQNPGGSGAPGPTFKYLTQVPLNKITFSEENDFVNYLDFISENNVGYDFNSFFITGYKLPGQALRKLQIPYIYVFSRNPFGSQCAIQALWDYANGTANGKESTRQIITMGPNSLYRKVRLRGRGIAVQFKIASISKKPFDLMGWSVWSEVNPVV